MTKSTESPWFSDRGQVIQAVIAFIGCVLTAITGINAGPQRNTGYKSIRLTCHKANHGTFSHKCGKPATAIGTKANGFRSGFCAHRRQHEDERSGFVAWEAS